MPKAENSSPIYIKGKAGTSRGDSSDKFRSAAERINKQPEDFLDFTDSLPNEPSGRQTTKIYETGRQSFLGGDNIINIQIPVIASETKSKRTIRKL